MQINSSIPFRSPDVTRAQERPAAVSRESAGLAEGVADADDTGSRFYAASLVALRQIDRLAPLLQPVE